MNIPIFHKDIQTELKTKRSDYLTVSSRSAFVRMIPGFSLDGKYADKYIISSMSEGMQNGYNLEFKDLYKESTHYRAIAGIKDISIEFKNKMGSVRKATINWFCPTKTQLEELSIYFLQSGLTVYLDWGWLNTGKDYLIPTYPKWINDNKITINNIYDFILGNPDNKPSADKPHDYSGLVYTTNGNYDGFIGIITNFAFNMTADGSYDCKTEIASPGILGEGVATDNVVQTGAPSVSKIRNFSDYLKTGFYPQLLGDSFKTLTAPDNYIAFLDVNEYDRYFGSKDAYKPSADDIKLPSEITDEQLKEFMTDSPSYVSWGYIEDNILNNSINGLTGLTFNSVSSPVTATKGVYPILRTTDLSTCIIPFDNSKYTDVTIDIKIPTETFVSSGVSSTGQYTATPEQNRLADVPLTFVKSGNISVCEVETAKTGTQCLITIPGLNATLDGSVNWAKAIYNKKFRNSTKLKRIISVQGPSHNTPNSVISDRDITGLDSKFDGINKLYIVVHSSGVWTANYILSKYHDKLKTIDIVYIMLDNDFNGGDYTTNLTVNLTNLTVNLTGTKIGSVTYKLDKLKLYYVYAHTKDNKIYSDYTKGGHLDNGVVKKRFDGFKVIPILNDTPELNSEKLHCKLVNTLSTGYSNYVSSVNSVTSSNVLVSYFDAVFNNAESVPTGDTAKIVPDEVLNPLYRRKANGILDNLLKYILTGDESVALKVQTYISEFDGIKQSIRSFMDSTYDDGGPVYNAFIDKFIADKKIADKDIELFNILFSKYNTAYEDPVIENTYGPYFLLFLLPKITDIKSIKSTDDLISKFKDIYKSTMKDVAKMNGDTGEFANTNRIKFYTAFDRGALYSNIFANENRYKTLLNLNADGSVFVSYSEIPDFNNNVIFSEERLEFVKKIYLPAMEYIYTKIITPLIKYYISEYTTVVEKKLLGGYKNTWSDKQFRDTVIKDIEDGNTKINNIVDLLASKMTPPIFTSDSVYMTRITKVFDNNLYHNTGKPGNYGEAMALLNNTSTTAKHRYDILMNPDISTTNDHTVGMGLNVFAGIHKTKQFADKFAKGFLMLNSMADFFTTMINYIGSPLKYKLQSNPLDTKLPSKIGNYNLSMDSVITPEEANKIKRSRNFDNNFIIKFDFYVEPSPTFRRVLINAEFFRITMLNSKTILDGVSSILRSVNRALSYYWNLEIYFNESTRTYYVADANTNNTPTKDIYEFKLLSGSPNLHVVKNMSFSTKTSTLAAVNTFFASAKSSTEAGIVGQGNEVIFDGLYKKTKGTIVKDMFYTDVKKDSSITVDVQKLCDDSALNLYNTHVQQFFANKMLMYLPIPFTYKLDGKSNTINKWEYAFPGKAPEKNTKTFLYGDAGLRILLNKKMYDNDVISMIIPLEMEIEVLGISGINIGDCFQVDYMPEVFRTQGLFFVSGVTHSVANNMWITKLKSSFRIVPGMETLK